MAKQKSAAMEWMGMIQELVLLALREATLLRTPLAQDVSAQNSQ